MRHVVPLLLAASVLVACTGDDIADDGSATTIGATGTTVAAEGDDSPSVPASAPSTSSTSSTTSSTTVTVVTSPPTVQTTEPPTDVGAATGVLEDADVQIDTDAGTIEIGVAEVPDGVSDSFPIPPDLDVQLSSATDTDFGFSGVSAHSIADLAEFYDAELTVAGYVITARQETTDVIAVYTFERDDEFGQVAISTAPGSGTSVIVTIGDGTSRTDVSVGS